MSTRVVYATFLYEHFMHSFVDPCVDREFKFIHLFISNEFITVSKYELALKETRPVVITRTEMVSIGILNAKPTLSFIFSVHIFAFSGLTHHLSRKIISETN